jgi:hypothetical protein
MTREPVEINYIFLRHMSAYLSIRLNSGGSWALAALSNNGYIVRALGVNTRTRLQVNSAQKIREIECPK